MSVRLPRPRREEAWALFLDFDGTLTEIVATPDRVHVDPALRATLGELVDGLDGALAVISGRISMASLARALPSACTDRGKDWFSASATTTDGGAPGPCSRPLQSRMCTWRIR